MADENNFWSDPGGNISNWASNTYDDVSNWYNQNIAPNVNFSGGDYAGVNPNYFSAPVNDYSQKWDYVSPVNDYDFSQTPEAYGGGNWNFDNVNFEDPAFNTSYRESPQFTDFQEDQWYTPWNESKNQDAGQWWTDTTKDWGLNSGINGDTGYVIPDTQKIVEISNWKESNQQPFYTGGGYPMSDIPGTVGAENFGRWSNNYPPDKTVIGSSPKPVWNDGLWIAPGSGSLSDISGSNGYNNMVRFEFSDAAGKLGIPSSKTVVSPPNFARFSSENRGQYEVKPELEILPKMSSMTTTPLADIKYLDASKTELPYNFERDFKFQLPWNPTGEAKNDWVSGLKNVDWSGSGGVVLTNPKTGFSDPMYTRDIAVAPDINDDWTTAALKRTVSAGLPNTVSMNNAGEEISKIWTAPITPADNLGGIPMLNRVGSTIMVGAMNTPVLGSVLKGGEEIGKIPAALIFSEAAKYRANQTENPNKNSRKIDYDAPVLGGLLGKEATPNSFFSLGPLGSSKDIKDQTLNFNDTMKFYEKNATPLFKVSTELASGVVIGAPIDVALDVMAAKKAVDATKVIDVASLARNAEKTGSVGWLDNIKTALTPNPDHMAAAGTFFNKVKSEAGAFGDDLLGFFRGKAPGERSLQPALATADVGAPILRTGDSVVSPLAKIDIPTNTAVRIDLPVAESTPKGGNVSAFSSGSGEITGNAPMRQPGELFVDIRTGRLMQEPLPPISKDISSKLNESQLIEYDKYRYQNFDARTNNNQALIDSTQKAMSEIETTGQVGKGTIKQVKSDASHPVILDSAKVSPASQKFVSHVTATPSPATPKAHVASGTDGGVPSSRSVKEVQTDLTGAQREQNMAFKNYDKKVSDYDAIAETSPLKSQAKINMEESAANLNATNRRVDSLRGELDAANIRSSSESPQTWIKQNYAKTKKTSFVRTSDSDVEIRNQNQKINNDANQARFNQVAFDATPEGQALKLRNQNQAINNATNQARSNKASGEAIVYPSSDYSPKMFSTDVSKELQDIGVYAGIAGLATAGGLTVGGSIAYDLKQRMKDGSKTTATPSTLPGQRVITENKTNLPSISGYSWSDQVYATPFSNSTYAKDAEGKYLDPSIKADGKSKYEGDRYIVYKGALIPPWDPIYDTIKAKLGVYSPPSVKTDTTVTPGEKTVKTTMGSALAVSGSTTPIQTNSRSQIPWNLDPNSDLAKTLLATGVVPSWSKALNATGGNFVGTKNDPELHGILPFTSSNVKNPVTTAAGEYDPKTKDMRLATKYVALDAQRRPVGSPVDISLLNQWETKNHEMAHSFYYNTLTPQQQEEWSQLYKDNKPFIDGVIKNQQKFDLNEYDDEYQAAEAYAKLAQRGQYYGIMQSLLPISFQGEEGNVVNLGTQEQYEKAYPLYEKAMSYYPQYSWSDPEYYHKSPNYWGPNGGAYDRARVTQSKHTRKKTIQNKIGKANKRISV